MNIRSLGPHGDEEIIIEVYYREQYDDVTIIANSGGLEYLRDIVQLLLESDISEKHFHIAKYSGLLEGNVYELTLQRK